MTITTLQPEALSLWIAEKMEPFDSLPDVKTWNQFESPEGFWLIGWAGKTCFWAPILYSDPEIALRLLKGLIEKFPTLIVHKDYVRAEPLTGKYYEGKAYGKGIERAIAESWALANGFKESE